jgi:hypothetical protein
MDEVLAAFEHYGQQGSCPDISPGKRLEE